MERKRIVRGAVRVLMGAIGALAVIVAAAFAAARIAARRRLAAETAALLAERRPIVAAPAADPSELPPPIQRWLRRSGGIDRPAPAVVRLRQTGRLRDAPGQPWRAFVARQVYTLDPPGFVWVARVRIAPLVDVVVTDRYRAGRGSADVRVLGFVPIGHGAGPELDQGALLRFLDESMWFPMAALSPAIQWEAIDASRARATMRDGAATGSAVFAIDDAGRFLTVEAERYRTVGERYELTPWATPARAWGMFEGVTMPIAGDGVWRLPSGDFAYIELKVTNVEYDPLDAAPLAGVANPSSS